LTQNVANLFAKKFIARTDAKAVQYSTRDKVGVWAPHTLTGKSDGERIPWRREDLDAPLDGSKTYGHYLLSTESKCKLFAFDVDLEKAGFLPSLPLVADDGSEISEEEWKASFRTYDGKAHSLRDAWLDRANPGRDFMKLQFKQMAHMLLRAIVEELGLPCAAAYSGGKGIHVYGFTGLVDASEARLGAQIVLDSIGAFEPLRGDNFFKHTDGDMVEGYGNLSIEVFPKQDSLDGKDLGNLMRLPLGRNLKAPQEPTFFLDMTAPFISFQPMDATTALTISTPWDS
jgi:hypothetical protein